MVKPSKTMQPEHVDLQEASKRTGKGAAFGEDSFRNYMALKIATQRKQFGLVLPPPPIPPVASASKKKPPPQTSKPAYCSEIPMNDFVTSEKRSKSTNPKFRAHSSNRMAVTASIRNPVSGGVSTPSEVIENPSSCTKAVHKRPTLLERKSLAPIPHMVYPRTRDGPIEINFIAKDSSNKECAPSDRSVHFAEHAAVEEFTGRGEIKRAKTMQKTRMESMISRLKKRHGSGNRRLGRKNVKKRKLSYCADRIETTNVSMDPPVELAEKEDGLAELERLFAMADDNDLNVSSKRSSPKAEDKACLGRGPEIETIPTDSASSRKENSMDPASSMIGVEKRKLEPSVGHGLEELERIFAIADAEKDNDSPLSLSNRELENGKQDDQGDNRTEADRMFSTTTRATTDDLSPLLFPNEASKTTPSVASSEPVIEGLVDESTQTTTIASSATPSETRIRRLRPDLFFYGVVVKIAGYTHPDNESIKRLLQKHGGDIEAYETERVTHIIAQQLSMAKRNVYKNAKRPRPVCRPSWIVDSVREGKLLPCGKYLLIEERDQQQMGIETMFKKIIDSDRQLPISSTTHSPEKPSILRKNPYARKKMGAQSPEKRDENLSSLNKIAQHSPAHDDGHDRKNGDLNMNRKTDKKFINGKIRTVGTDPNFLDSYFASSRLSFIGSFKQRTVLSHQSNGTKFPLHSNMKQLIFHVDMDCFFASVVLRNFPQFKDRPVVISHHGNRSFNERKDEERGNNHHASSVYVPKNSSSECATCNYEARKYGIKKGMFLGRAKELCPELVVLMYDFEGYEEVSQQVLDILHRFCASENHRGVVETVSCDEAYVALNFDAPKELRTLYDHAYHIAESIRKEIFDTTRCTASIGVGANKFLAKLGTDKAKPNKSFCVRDYREILKGLKLRDVHGVGWRTEKKLLDEGLVTVQDVWDLGSRGETELIRILGPGNGKKIFDFTQGQDDRPITPAERKTIGAECNYGVRFDGPYGIDHFMEGLAKEVEKRMEGISMKGKKFTLKIKQRKKGASNKHKFLGHGSCHNLSKSVDIPGNFPTRDAKIFKKTGLNLFREFGIADIQEIRGMGITISSLENDNIAGKQNNTSGMQDWLRQNVELEKNEGMKVTEEGDEIADFVDEIPTKKNEFLVSTPKLKKKNWEVSGDVVVEKVFGNEKSPLMIELPPMSQIQMSQVKALPLDLQQQVFSRMKRASALNINEKDTLENNFDSEELNNERVTSNEFIENVYDDAIEEASINMHDFVSTPQSMGKRGVAVEEDEHEKIVNDIESPLLIDLPPMSQIHMSQVEALPPDLQQQIRSRMDQKTNNVAEEDVMNIGDEAQPPINRIFPKQQIVESEQQHYANRFRQTDLKRMMKLAAVRSGQENASISLTQLEQLPLEIKLQVVNHDDRQLGFFSQHAPQSVNNHGRSRKKSTSNKATGAGGSNSKRIGLNPAKDTTGQEHRADTGYTMNTPKVKKGIPQRKFRIFDRVDVWKEDLLPLKEFLNDNCPLQYPNSIDMVVDFLSIVLKEGRLPDMVTMIRCIRNRKDEWSKIKIIERIVQTMNDLHIKQYGASLDVAWLMGVEG